MVHGLIARLVDAPEGGTVDVWGDGTAVRSFIHVDDVATGILVVLDSGDAGAAYNVDTSDAISIRELAERIRDLASPTATLAFDTSRPSGPQRRVPDSARLRELGFSPAITLGEGLAGTIDWYRSHRAVA